MVFQGRFKDISNEFDGCLREFQEGFKTISRQLVELFLSVS